MTGGYSVIKQPQIQAQPPSIAHTVGGGYKDMKVQENFWWQEQLDGQNVMILSAMERRWLYEGFAAMNVIEVEYIDMSGATEIGSGAFGKVEKVTYRPPGREGIPNLSLQL